MNAVATFLINLDDSVDRLAIAGAQLDATGIRFARHAAFDGRGMDPTTRPEYDEDRAIRWFGRPLSGGELGCYFSHVQAAQRIVDSGADFGLVLEDDMSIQGDAVKIISEVVDFLSGEDGTPPPAMVNLGRPVKRFYTPVLDLGADDAQLCRAHYFPDTSTAMLWTAAGARAFLAAAYPIYMPVDHFLRRWGAETDIGLGLTTVPFTPSGAESDIDSTVSRDYIGRARFYHLRKHRRLWQNKRAAKRNMSMFQTRPRTSQHVDGLDVRSGKIDKGADFARQATPL